MSTSTGSQAQIFIGYDEREHKAYEVCEFSIKQRSEIKVNKLFSKDIETYNRDWGEPMSTDFTFTRFWAVQRAQEFLEIDPSFRVKYNKAKVLARQRLKINGYEYRRRDQTSPYGDRAFER